MNRREFLKALLAGSAATLLNKSFALRASPLYQTRALPPVQTNTFSSEIVLNSRRSYHSGYNGTLSDQILANALWAAAKSPLIGSSRTIYVALPDNVYRYDPSQHELVFHKAGNQLSESNLAFEIGIASNVIEDAGTALHYAHLASIAFWVTTSNQPSCCPKQSGAVHANSTWSPVSTVHMVNCYGLMPTVSGITDELVAHSSDASLPDPSTDGTVLLENALGNLGYGSEFSAGELSLNDISQLAWASYGCNPHYASNGRAALVVASATASYYLTGRIYIVRSVGVERYHIRLPSGQPTTRDHRIERVTNGDRRTSLRSAVPRLPQTAPNYYVYCATTTNTYQLLEAGYCGAGALLQASSMNQQGYFTANFTSSERTAIINALGIPSADLPCFIFSAGTSVGIEERTDTNLIFHEARPNPFRKTINIRYALAAPAYVTIAVYDRLGKQIKNLLSQQQDKGMSSVAWHGTDNVGKKVPSGVYYYILTIGKKQYKHKLVKL